MDPSDAVDARDLERLALGQGREDRRQPAREHRLADARRAGHEQVVTAGRCDGQRLDDVGVAADVGEVEMASRQRDDRRVGLRWRWALAPAQDLGDLGEAADADDVQPVDERRFEHALERDDESLEAGSRGSLRHRERPAARPDRAAEPELAEDRVALERVGGDVAAHGEDGARDREVEAGPRLAQRRRREVDRHTSLRELEAGVEDRRADALARLAHRPVGEADDREVGQARADVDLDGHAPRFEAVDREGADAGEHGRRR
jgi:hypothetical protein